MRMALIRDGVAVNIIEAEKGYEPGKGLRVVDAANADIGARFNGKSFEAASPAPAPVPAAAALWAVRAALRRAGLFAAIDSGFESGKDAAPDIWEAWTMGGALARDSRLLAAIAAGAKLGADEIDALLRGADVIARSA